MKPLIQVCGDPTVDWLRISNDDVVVRGGVYFWQKQPENSRVRLSSKPGGSILVQRLLSEMLDPEKADIQGVRLEEELLSRPKDCRITTSWTVWKEFAHAGLSQTSFRLWKWQEFEPAGWDYASGRLTGRPDLLVIWDSDLGFRDQEAGWPEAITSQEGPYPDHILIKLGQYNDGQRSPLLERIVDLGLASRTTLISSLSDLRACPVKVGISLSWERMLEEVVRAVLSPKCPFADEQGKGLRFHQVIIPIETSGAVMVGSQNHTLIFDCGGQEGDFAQQFPGQMLGENSVILAGLVASWVDDPRHVDWVQAARVGIQLARLLHIKGYDVVKQDGFRYLEFPYRSMARAYRTLASGPAFSSPDNDLLRIGHLGVFTDRRRRALHHPGSWTILESTLLNQEADYAVDQPHSLRAVKEIARDIVVDGPQDALLGIPVESIGSWHSADRQEIEGVRSVRNAMRDYLQLKNPRTPLCVAVFGPPGAGKSFVVKEIARGLDISEDAQLTFNLSQFESYLELQNAFHQVRDLNLQGKMPLVFWDEFDTPCEDRPLGWLRYFLAPMQDGEFTYQGLTHHLGGGIYVFAGATRYSFEEFSLASTPEDRSAKKPDFISRLRAYINIQSINGSPNTVEDRLYTVRRAFVLRHYLETQAPQILHHGKLDMDEGVLDAFLLITKYGHGTRSMENLLKMSSLTDKRKFELSCLPPDHIVGMHVNLREFKELTELEHREMLRIGILGHIHLDPRCLERIRQAVQRAIDFIEQHFPDHYLTVFSPLADGAERLAARELLKRDGTRLIPVLPVPREEYLKDFGDTDDHRVDPRGAELRQELKYWLAERAIEIIEMPPAPTRQDAFFQTGRFIAEHSDALLVIWDGWPSEDASITAQVVAEAAGLSKPLCHIRAAKDQENSPTPREQDRTGTIRYRGFPGQVPGGWQELSGQE